MSLPRPDGTSFCVHGRRGTGTSRNFGAAAGVSLILAGEVNPKDRLKCSLVGKFVGMAIRFTDNHEIS